VFAIVSIAGWEWGLLSGFLVGTAILIQQRRAGWGVASLILEYGTTAFFLVVTIIAFASPHSPLRTWSVPLSMGWLACIAWLSLLVGRPFTVGIARRSIPREYWNNRLFLHVNIVITAVWAATFTVITAASTALQAAHASAVASVAINSGYLVPIVFTSRYPDIARAAALRKRGDGPG
jgi:hypothetical protein